MKKGQNNTNFIFGRALQTGKKDARNILTCLFAVVCLCMAGCGSSITEEEIAIPKEKNVQSGEVENVMRGDVDVSIRVTMTANSEGTVTYHADHEGMAVKNIPYKTGDIVKAGDVLVEFKSDEIMNAIYEAEDAIEKDLLLYEHVQKLKSIYPSRDYTTEEARLINDSQVNAAKKEEYTAWLDAYTIKAEDDGVVGKVSDVWQQTKVGPEDSLITVNYASGKFAGSTIEDYEFAVGGEYDALVGIADRKIVIDEITEDGTDEAGRTKRKISGHLSDGISTDETSITLFIEKPILKDALYISRDSVKKINGRIFVYVFDENDIPVIRRIDAWEDPNGKIIINSGLEEGERVVSKP